MVVSRWHMSMMTLHVGPPPTILISLQPPHIPPKEVKTYGGGEERWRRDFRTNPNINTNSFMMVKQICRQRLRGRKYWIVTAFQTLPACDLIIDLSNTLGIYKKSGDDSMFAAGTGLRTSMLIISLEMRCDSYVNGPFFHTAGPGSRPTL